MVMHIVAREGLFMVRVDGGRTNLRSLTLEFTLGILLLLILLLTAKCDGKVL